MADKEKNFRTDSNPTNTFISAPDVQPDYSPPKGYKLVPETKSAKVHLMVTPRLKADLLQLAKENGTSLNAFVNKVLFDYVEGGNK